MKLKLWHVSCLYVGLWAAPGSAQQMYRCQDMYNHIYTQDHMSPGCTPFAAPPPPVNFNEIDQQAGQLRRNRNEPQSGNGWARFGSSMGSSGQRQNDAYYQGMMQGIAARQAEEQARRALATADEADSEAQIESTWRLRLLGEWKGLGVPENEAKAMADSFKLDNEFGSPLFERIRNDGWKSGVEGALKARKEYNVKLANYLLVVSCLVFDQQATMNEHK